MQLSFSIVWFRCRAGNVFSLIAITMSSVIRCPDEFICPITQEIMRDPVLISETGQVRQHHRRFRTHACTCCKPQAWSPRRAPCLQSCFLSSESVLQTYERAAIQDWWARGHGTCPVTGTVLSTYKLTPNYVLKRYSLTCQT